MPALRSLLPGPGDLAAARRDPRSDLVAGVTVAIVALPLALAFGVSSGLGAQAGLATAIVAGKVVLASDVLFPGGSMEVVEPVYRGNRWSDHFNTLTARQVAAAGRR